MTIDPVGPVDPVPNPKKAPKADRPNFVDGKDSVQLSDEAKSMAELYRAKELATNSPEVRADRIAEVKAKLQDPSYISEKVIDELADRLMESFGL